jgi:thiamine pyrophosphate-dependent acetolactate synthase large subunit-like protein
MVKRYDLLKTVASMVTDDMLVVTPIGNTSVFWEELAKGTNSLTGVSLGMCTPVALGLALALPHRKVIALDSDGNLILNLCSLGTVGNKRPRNLTIIVFDNGNYLSGGPGKGKPGMPTATAGNTNLEAVAKGCGIANSTTIQSEAEFKQAIEKNLAGEGPSLIVAKIDAVDVRDSKVFRDERTPGQDTRENKYSFARHVERLEKIRIIRRGSA